MTLKKYLIIAFVISAGAVFGFFSFFPTSKTLYINNSSKNISTTPQILSVHLQDAADLTTSAQVPEIKPTQNLTENFANTVAQGIISQNDQPQVGALLPGPGLNMPNIDNTVGGYIQSGMKQANENILNITPVQLVISSDDSKDAVSAYLSKTQAVINDNLEPKDSGLIDVLQEIENNNGTGAEKLTPIAISYEETASKIEENPVPSSLKNLITEEIQLLRITANDLKALTNSETDPIGTVAATNQFSDILKNWQSLQEKFDTFIKELNQS